QLRQARPAAWQEGNSRLYEHLQRTAEECPDTLEEMAPLYAAVAHGCQAGRHQEALDNVYGKRIRRGDEAFSIRKLGAYGADLAALSGFFDTPWCRPVAGLTPWSQSLVLGEAGFCLQALGRLAEALEPMKAGLGADLEINDWDNAAISASNLS